MANTARVSQSVLLVITSPSGRAKVSQSVVLVIAQVTAPPVTPSSGSAKSGEPTCNPFKTWNTFDECLRSEVGLYNRIQFPETEYACAIPIDLLTATPWDDDGAPLALPKEAKILRVENSIVTPTTASGDNLVTSFECPIGFDGFITAVVFYYSGTGFVPGSGDLIFRIKVWQRFLKDYAAVPFTLGSPSLPFPLSQGYLVRSASIIQGIVNVPNLSGNIQIGHSNIVMGFFGFFWPRGMPSTAQIEGQRVWSGPG